MHSGDTIAAISSAAGPAARMIVRLSGPSTPDVVVRLTGSSPPPAPGSANHVDLHFANLTCPGWVYFFCSPHSYTGEDAAEFHLPGNPLLAQLLLDDLLRHGIRLAEAGEFTARAFFAGKLDLTEAEGVAAVIAAGNAAELQAARQLLAGELSCRLAPTLDQLAQTLALVEANIDFAEEDIAFVQQEQVRQLAQRVDDELTKLLAESNRFESLAQEPRIVLLGRPNAGKSTLMNALTGQLRAIVSPVAGTTRDVLSAPLDLPRGRVQLVDVAGLDPALAALLPPSPERDIEHQTQSLALQAAETAPLLLLIRDVTDPLPPPVLPRDPDLTVWTKVDLIGTAPNPAGGDLFVSADVGIGLAELRDRLDQLAFGLATQAPRLALTGRHVAALAEARGALARVISMPSAHPVELVAHDLREALDALGSIRGAVTPDDILGRVFATFCIGK